ncbi:hypothetical protein [Streptomyces sp. AN091965]|uniref:hypothetical protein n=1 Tax=Streptomyces sp. AN091965 TaxID=2927803 RepID=UPI001F6214B7|nr:hypothetical protein [Streptomyces sp. AN091965]MCI3932105.1 hypothetical protein [Streptomyces sp. AN091965]
MQPAADDGETRLDADVDEFATHDRKGGWARALIVARRVTPRAGQGLRTDRQLPFARKEVFLQISATEFARRTGVSIKRVMAFYQAWERAARDGIVPTAKDLAPGTAVALPDEDAVPFFGENGYYRSWEASLREERRQAIVVEAERAGVKPNSSVFIAGHPAALTAAVVADATSRNAALRGIEEFERRQDQEDTEARAAAQQTVEERDRQRGLEQESPDAPGCDAGAAPEPETALDVKRAVRAAIQEKADQDVALQVFTEMTEVRLGTLRALSLLQRYQVQFTGDRSRAISELCGAAQAALAFIRDLASGPYTALNDEALQAFLNESEKKLG